MFDLDPPFDFAPPRVEDDSPLALDTVRRDEDTVLGAALATRLDQRFRTTPASGILAHVLGDQFAGHTAVVSSFGAESAALLALVADVDRATPVIFLETGKHFPETLAYRDRLVDALGLTAVRMIEPDAERLAAADSEGTLWARDPDACCAVRKVEPLERALDGFDVWITGRKRFQSAGRRSLATAEWDGRHLKINPLARWSPADIEAFLEARGLPRHPMVAQGFLSIGCMPCTARVGEGEDARSGRWQGSDKTECGIHRPLRKAA